MSHFDVEFPYAFESNVWLFCYTVSAFKLAKYLFSSYLSCKRSKINISVNFKAIFWNLQVVVYNIPKFNNINMGFFMKVQAAKQSNIDYVWVYK